jgi:hypothetical protein
VAATRKQLAVGYVLGLFIIVPFLGIVILG